MIILVEVNLKAIIDELAYSENTIEINQHYYRSLQYVQLRTITNELNTVP